MSFSDIDQNVPLDEDSLFSHSAILKPEIKTFCDKFDYNKQEFDGLIRRNHRIYEANDSFPQMKVDNLNSLLDNLKKVEDRLKLIGTVSFSKNDLSAINPSNLTQIDILKLAEAKLQECTSAERLDMIREVSVEDSERTH